MLLNCLYILHMYVKDVVKYTCVFVGAIGSSHCEQLHDCKFTHGMMVVILPPHEAQEAREGAKHSSNKGAQKRQECSNSITTS